MDNKKINRIELCAHTCDSPLGLCTAKELVFKAKEYGLSAVAICDNYSTNGYTQFYKECKNANIKAIYGATLVVDSHVVVVLAKNKNGIFAINKLISVATPSNDIYRYKNENKDLLEYKKDLITIVIAFDYTNLVKMPSLYFDYIGVVFNSLIPDNIINNHKNDFVAISNSYYLEKNDQLSFDLLLGKPSLENAKNILHGCDVSSNYAKEIIYDNPNKIALAIEDDCFESASKLLLPDLISIDDFKALVEQKKKNRYSGNVSDEVKKRVFDELNIISINKTHNIFYISYLIAKYMQKKNIYFDSRLAAPSSIICYILGITDVDPIKWKIPLETFYGVDGFYKTPEISFNIERNDKGHISELMSSFNDLGIFKAGVINRHTNYDIAEMLNDYFGKYNHKIYYEDIINTKIFKIKNTLRYINPINSYIFLPNKEEIYNYSPINYEFIYTLNDYHDSLSNFYKMDLPEQDYCNLLSLLSESTKLNYKDINYNDSKVLSLFSSDDALNKQTFLNFSHNSFVGVPEFNTEFMGKVFNVVKPKTIDEIIKIVGFAHGTGTWNYNAELLINEGKNINDLFSSREDIFNYLINKGANKSFAFQTMETIRKGRGVNFSLKEKLVELNIPNYLIESMNKIHYLFYKGALVTSVIARLKILYYKVYYPKEFYTCLFKIHKGTNAFDKKLLSLSKDDLLKKLIAKDENLINKNAIEELIEAFERGYIYQNGRFVTKKDLN